MERDMWISIDWWICNYCTRETNIWEHLTSWCIAHRHLNEQGEKHTHLQTHAESNWPCWNVLECTSFLHKTLIFSLVPHRVTHYSKHALNPLLKDPKIPHTKTHLWCRQTSTGKKTSLPSVCWKNNKMSKSQARGPLILTGRGRQEMMSQSQRQISRRW